MPIIEAKEYKSFEEIKQTDENVAEFRFARGFIPNCAKCLKLQEQGAF